MAIDALRDGFVRLCFDPSLNVLGTPCKLVFEGQMYDDGGGEAVAPDILRPVNSTRSLNENFGAGSVLAESLRLALECCGSAGVEIFALPRLDAAGAVAAEYTLTLTGDATSAGRIDIYAGEQRWNISVPVAAGDTVTDMAAAIAAAFDVTFPYTVTSAAGVVTFVAKNAGTVGNHMIIMPNWHGRNNYLPLGPSFVVTQTVVGATDPTFSDHQTVFGECCICCYGLLSGDAAWQANVQSFLDAAWACDTPQCFGHGYTYNAGTLGEVLAGDTNAATLSRVAHGVLDPILPWMKTTAYAAVSCCTTIDNPEISVQGPTFGVLDCVGGPEGCLQSFSFEEQEQLRAAGFVVTTPVSNGQGALTAPMVTNDITNRRFDDDGRENLTFRSTSSRRLATQTATAFAEHLQQFNGLGLFTEGTEIRRGTQGTNPRAILGATRAWAQSQVGILFSEFDDLNEDLQLTTDFDSAARCQGIPGKLAINFIYRPPVRVQQIDVNAVPRLLDNCG